MPCSRFRMGSAHLSGAEMDHSGKIQGRAEGVELALPQVAQFEPLRLAHAEQVAGALLVTVQPRPPDDHVVGLGRGVLVKLA